VNLKFIYQNSTFQTKQRQWINPELTSSRFGLKIYAKKGGENTWIPASEIRNKWDDDSRKYARIKLNKNTLFSVLTGVNHYVNFDITN